MVAWNRIYLNDLAGAHVDALAAVEAAIRVGHQRAEMVARLTAGRVFLELGKLTEADEHVERGLKLAEQLGANRFKPFLMIHLAQSQFHQQKPRGEITKMMQNALSISRETGTGFLGPWVLGTLALVSEDAETSRAALAEGEEILAGDCVGHNYFGFYPNAMEVALRHSDWPAVEHYAAALETYSRAEPLPWSDFFAARGRALAAFHQGDRSSASIEELSRLTDVARAVGLCLHLKALEAALSTAAQSEK